MRRDSGESYREMLTRMAQESGVATPTIDDLVRLDRKRQGKKLSNEDWTSPTDPDAKIAKMKDGTTHLAYKPEHAVDLDTGVIVAAPIHAADEGDTTTLEPTLAEVQKSLSAVGLTPTAEDPCDLVADKGYHSRAVLKALADGAWKTRIAEPLPSRGYLSWHGDEAARAAVYGNRTRLRSCVGNAAGSSNAPRRIQPACIAMQQKRNHHPRIERRLAEPTHIAAHDCLEIQALPHQPNDKPRDVVLGHEVPHIRRQKQRLIDIPRAKVLAHSPSLNQTCWDLNSDYSDRLLALHSPGDHDRTRLSQGNVRQNPTQNLHL